ncbi:MAG: hypothetical protein JW779_02915 [Candidatus Thorarchaeota archaeon]|nr:hypothetical protein [Candidatus Thorarchaeota archaeon]
MSRSESKQVKKRTWMMPQEVEVWYVLPAIRRELAKILKTKAVQRVGEDGKIKERKVTQKEIAKILGVTEPAITQYLLKKKGRRSRGDQVIIPEKFIPEIDKSADKMLATFEEGYNIENMFEDMTREVNRIIKLMRDDGAMCDIHRQFSAHVKGDCNACKK